MITFFNMETSNTFAQWGSIYDQLQQDSSEWLLTRKCEPFYYHMYLMDDQNNCFFTLLLWSKWGNKIKSWTIIDGKFLVLSEMSPVGMHGFYEC